MKLNGLQKFYLLIQIKQVLQFNKEKIQYPHRMYGSFLNFQTIKLIRPYLIAAYGTQYYIFDTNTQLCMSQINIGHQSKILCSTVVGAKNQYNLFSLDSSGLFVRVEIKFQVPGSDQQQRSGIKFNVLQKFFILPKNKKEIVTITSATFVDQNCILFINSHKKLQRYDVQNNSLSNIAYQSSFSEIKHNKDQSYVFLIEQEQQNMKIYSKQSHSIHQSYIHQTKITSCAFTNQILIIGDSKGKITLLYQFFNQNKKKSKKQKLSSTLEWHTGPVLSLCSNGQYIYSAGQQSVVVLWHIRDLSRDFLPRVRTSINYLAVNIQTNEIICGLSDNSIKIIDLSRDKQTQTYRTIVDPQGYAPKGSSRFSNYTTNYKDGLLCLNSVPGKLQFLNFNKNGENVQLQIVPRNLINSIDEDKVSPHRIFCTSFSQDWSTLLTSLNIDNNSSYLKFYHKGVQGYQLINKIQNPHLGLTKACLSIGNKKFNKFITYSLKDQVIRVWQQFRQKKKSIIDSSEVFWKYSQQIKHRNLFPTFVSCYKSFIIIVYNNIQIVLYQLKQTGLTQSIETITTHYKIQQVFIIQCEINKSKRNIKLLLITKQLDFQIVSYSQQKKQQKINILSQIHLNKNISSYFITPGLKQIVLIAKNSQKSCQIVTLDRKLTKFTQIFDCDTYIQSAFWIQDRLMAITEDLTISSLDGKQFIKFTQKDGTQIHQMSQQTTEIKVLGQDIFKINSRWVERQTLKDKKKTSDNLQGLGLFPNCKSAWEQISFKLLI